MPQALRDLPVLDCHIHYAHPDLMPGLIHELDANRVGKFNIVCTPHRQRLSLVPDALHLKAHHPGRVYVFGGLDISALFIAPDTCGEYFAWYVDALVEMGCDGVKMIEGKPDMRKTMPVPDFDSPAYAPYWARMEETGMPLIFHVNDPEEFWDASKVPDWAKQAGWFYGDGTYIHNEAQYTQVLNVVERHPGLKVIFAHFFFLSAQLERLGGYLDRFPNMHVDLTPGIEMYFNFARDPQQTRDFFLRYQDRILLGTDIGAKALLGAPGEGIDPGDSAIRVELTRSFLEKDGEFFLDSSRGYLLGKFGAPFQGIGLPVETLEKIYHANFERLAGQQPRAVNPAAVISECERLIGVIPMLGAAQPGIATDTSVAQQVKAYFENQL